MAATDIAAATDTVADMAAIAVDTRAAFMLMAQRPTRAVDTPVVT
jgi:hypothetical protein